MKRVAIVVVCLCFFAVSAFGQAAQPSGNSDIYHVHFAKAALGQAKALENQLSKVDPKAPMPGHFLVLRHQDGDDWDYAVIEHMGKKFEINPADYSAPTGNAAAIGDWHTDTFAVGPSWDVFAKEMGLGSDASKTAGSLYIVSTWRAAPGHRQELDKMLNAAPDPNAKVKSGGVVLYHIEGGPWNDLTLQRFDSWQDYATDSAANQDGQGWYDIRNHGEWHRDTLTTRVPSTK